MMNNQQYYTMPQYQSYPQQGDSSNSPIVGQSQYYPRQYPIQPPLQPPYQKAPVLTKKSFSPAETVLAWLCFLAGILYCRVFPVVLHPFGGLLFVAALFIATFSIIAVKRVKVGVFGILVGISGIIMGIPLITTSSDFILNISYGYSTVAFLYLVYTAGTGKKGLFKNALALDLFKMLFVVPFYAFVSVYKALFSGKSGFSGKMLLKILLGIAIAIIPTSVILALLSYDAAFMEMLSNLFDFTVYDIYLFIVDVIFAVPIAMYLFGLYTAATDRVDTKVIPVSSCVKTVKEFQIAPATTLFVSVIPVLFIYLIFFLSQWKYYVSGFFGDLPVTFSYAGYAREGFFQLIIVSVINLVIVLAVALFAKRREGKRSTVLTLTAILFSICTIILIATAVSKMVMYIDFYGLTPKRIYSVWFMIFLAAVFFVIILSRFIKKVKVVAIALSLFAVMLMVLTLFPVNRMIASYNVDRYLDGTIENIDYESMVELGVDGVPEFVRLAKELGEDGIDISETDSWEDSVQYALHTHLTEQAVLLSNRRDESGILSFNISQKAAIQALENAGYME